MRWPQWLPFIGFRTVTREDEPELFRAMQYPPNVKTVEAFIIEWFGSGIVVAAKDQEEKK